MNVEEFKIQLQGIAPALQCLNFLYERVLRDDYRGTHKLQHYRWDKAYIKTVLKYLPKDKMLYHTQGDIYEDYIYKDEEFAFCEYLARVNKDLSTISKSVTDMAMRKIIFVNLQRMGFIHRYNAKKKLCDVDKKSRYRYVQISQSGLNFLNAKDIFEEQKILGIALDSVFDGVVQDVLDIINELGFLSVSEMIFFVSYLGKNYENKILTKDKICEFILEFRSLKARQKVVENVISKFCNPKKFKGNKNAKRDFHNWKNEAQSLFDSLDLMSYFEFDRANERLLLKSVINGDKIIFKRSSIIKKLYFKEHEVQKDLCFELHHIVPFYFAKDIDALKAIDDWQNLIYIDANSHKIFSLDKNLKNALHLSFQNKDALLDDLCGNEKILKYIDNIKYKIALQERLLNYNKKLLGLE